jgi:hypothetical protein
MKVGKLCKKAVNRRETLGAFPIGNQHDGKSLTERLPDGFEDSRLRYKQERAGQAGPLKMCFKI